MPSSSSLQQILFFLPFQIFTFSYNFLLRLLLSVHLLPLLRESAFTANDCNTAYTITYKTTGYLPPDRSSRSSLCQQGRQLHHLLAIVAYPRQLTVPLSRRRNILGNSGVIVSLKMGGGQVNQRLDRLNVMAWLDGDCSTFGNAGITYTFFTRGLREYLVWPLSSRCTIQRSPHPDSYLCF